MEWNIYRKMFLFAITMIILPVSLLGFLSYRESETMLVDRIKQTSLLTMENAANHFIMHYIGETETTLNVLTSDPGLTEISTEQNAQMLLKDWEQHRRHSEKIWSILYGTAEGELFMVPSWERPVGYDPRITPWYQAAIKGSGIVWSEPYVELVTNNMVVTATKTMHKNGQLHGVFGIDTSLYKLSDIVRNINIGPGGYLVLLDANGNIIAHNELALLGTSVRDTVWYNKLIQAKGKSVYVNVEKSKTYVSAVVIPQTGWTLVGFLPEETFISEVAPIKTTTIVVALFGIIFASLVSAIVSKGFVSRIQVLVSNMSKIEQEDYEIVISDNSTDEIGELNRKFSMMVNTIRTLMDQRDLTETEIRRQKVYFAQLFENSPESIAILDPSDRIVTVNKHFEDFFQYEAHEVKGEYLNDLVVPPHLIDESVRYTESLRKEAVQEETVRRRKDGSLVDVQIIGYPIIINNGVVGAYAIYRDISERKETERQLEYLTYHDALTGVYNRAYFERQIELISLNNSGSFGVLVCDVDGLKLVNDSFGHARGDELLKTAAMLLQSIIHVEAVISRIGGDEFSLLLPKVNEITLQETVGNLQRKIAEFNALHPDCAVSLSIGYAIAKEGRNIVEALHEADSRMYKEKLHRSQSTRSAIVKTLMHALHARDFITEGHADRMQVMIEKLARSMDIPEFKIHDLRLFAQFHDIGKVGIPDSILFKSGPLDSKELDTMRRHSEIGYRIAISSPELNHIADWILKHHEWWNGNGYPIGLSGSEIPIECRILAICDAYDAMISERPYKEAISSKEALAEIERCSGTMFDPEIVRIFISIVQ